VLKAVLTLALLSTLPAPTLWTTASPSQNVEVASRASSGDDDRDDAKSSSRRPARIPGVKSSSGAPGGYDPQRVKRFWRHYHGARPEKQPKRLEREK